MVLATLTAVLLGFGLGCGPNSQPDLAQQHVQTGNQLLA